MKLSNVYASKSFIIDSVEPVLLLLLTENKDTTCTRARCVRALGYAGFLLSKMFFSDDIEKAGVSDQ